MISGLIFAAAVVTFTAYGTAPDRSTDQAAGRTEISITYDESDLRSEAGARALLRRIERAASKVCAGSPQPVELSKTAPYRECVRAAIDRAVYRIDASTLTRLYEQERTKTVERYRATSDR